MLSYKYHGWLAEVQYTWKERSIHFRLIKSVNLKFSFHGVQFKLLSCSWGNITVKWLQRQASRINLAYLSTINLSTQQNFFEIRLQVIQLAPVIQTLDNAIHRINHYPIFYLIFYFILCPTYQVRQTSTVDRWVRREGISRLFHQKASLGKWGRIGGNLIFSNHLIHFLFLIYMVPRLVNGTLQTLHKQRTAESYENPNTGVFFKICRAQRKRSMNNWSL